MTLTDGCATSAGGALAPADVVVDRAREIQLVEAALASGAHVVLEGPPGTGKSTLLRDLAVRRASSFVLVEGNAELTPARIVGQFDPAQVLQRGYDPAIFVDGPLLTAMREGGLFYVEEINRVPEETLNTLITVMSEREIAVPRLGTIAAAPGFALVAAMNPFDAVGTARISSAVHDRMCRVAMDYQSAEAEQTIVARRAPRVSDEWRSRAVELVRATRSHPDLRVGSSVRGAIDLVGVAHHLAAARGAPTADWHVGLDAARVALSGRVQVHRSAGRTAEDVIEEIYTAVFGPAPDTPEPSEAGGPGER
ncbi:MoxR family ATPase [Nocardia farcinica]|uniref:AAA+ ATPase domain-containing protein n=2 Tax=Nocardia farcinica TaxID=37329 RepID=Q5Z0J8_NOCFA|nr:MoxR family ATPase [Nocardia farcinica]AXK86076.1 MoxR family ATPase [Nocardia farcinica]MBF6068452.1 MoxR family ATPase [Nocardia farcinica]MBF6142466.1 MoxR family ATPase [Nocardia farcinica]MBF6231430.1 MoxR family ATPase [Nocardia farcinica]MBF6252346.1 MoxR family ATPase [Nocardia farcinica]